jgi:putative cell wall-binding protein
VEDKKLQEELSSNKTKKVTGASQTPKEQKSKSRLESAKRVQSQQRVPNSDDIMNVTRDGSSMGKGPYKNESPKR